MTAPGHSFYGYFNPKTMEGLSSSLAQLDDYIATEGPFDVIMGFSAGAVLAAAYLLQREAAQQSYRSIRCAIFLASADSTDELKYLGLDRQELVIRIPTAHIWGSADEITPTGGRDLSRLCDPALRSIMVHEGRHEVPRKEALTEAVHTIRRTLLLANQ
jgi:pimeloyl-ACP methyl ester carboxylesterase